MPSTYKRKRSGAYATRRPKKMQARRYKTKGFGIKRLKALPKKMKTAVQKAIAAADPPMVIRTHKRTEYNSVISSLDVGHFWKDVNTQDVGGLALVRRMAAIEGFSSPQPVSKVTGDGVKCSGLRYHGEFHLNPFVFGDNAIIQNNCVIVNMYILKDKYNPTGNATSDSNCVEDLLLDRQQLFPNAGDGYTPTAIQNMMIPHSGTIRDEQLPVNRRRFTVIKHKKWKIYPKSIAFQQDTGTSAGIACGGIFSRKFSVNIPTPKVLKWDRRVSDELSDSDTCQTPCNVGDPFVVWGYTPYPDGPDAIATNLVVDHYLTLKVQQTGPSAPA